MVHHSHAQALIVRLWGESSPEEITDLTVLHVTLTSAKAVFTENLANQYLESKKKLIIEQEIPETQVQHQLLTDQGEVFVEKAGCSTANLHRRLPL